MSDSQPFRKILVPISLTPTDAALLEYAAMLARLLGEVGCDVVHVRASGAGGTAEQVLALAEERARLIPATVRCHALEGPLEDSLLEFARDQQTDLILLGHQRTHSRRRALGRRLAMHAPCSVWIAPAGSGAQLRKILVPIDFSPNSADALRVAAELARRADDASLTVMHVRFNEASVTFEEYARLEVADESRAMKEFLDPIDLRGLNVRTVFEEAAQVAHAVDRVAERQGVDLVVMSTRGRSKSAAVLLGSQTEHVLIETERPLLAVKHFGSHLNVLEALLDARFRNKAGVRFG